MLRSIKLTFSALSAIIYAEKHFPERTPRRWQLIADLVKKASVYEQAESSSKTATAYITIGEGNTIIDFDYSYIHCKTSHGLLTAYHPDLIDFYEKQSTIIFSDPTRCPFKPLILLPPVQSCCDKSLCVR